MPRASHCKITAALIKLYRSRRQTKTRLLQTTNTATLCPTLCKYLRKSSAMLPPRQPISSNQPNTPARILFWYRNLPKKTKNRSNHQRSVFNSVKSSQEMASDTLAITLSPLVKHHLSGHSQINKNHLGVARCTLIQASARMLSWHRSLWILRDPPRPPIIWANLSKWRYWSTVMLTLRSKRLLHSNYYQNIYQRKL